jgi:hypothetical protein
MWVAEKLDWKGLKIKNPVPDDFPDVVRTFVNNYTTVRISNFVHGSNRKFYNT